MKIYNFKHFHNEYGFSLFELVCVLAIISILIYFVFPLYSVHVMHARRLEARTALARDQLLLEQCYSQNFSYRDECAFLPEFPHTSTQGFYSITLKAPGVKHYTLVAKPIEDQARDVTCAAFFVNQAHVKSAVDAAGMQRKECWA